MTPRDPRRRRRYVVLGGPSGQLSCVPVGSTHHTDNYRRWTELARFKTSGPMTQPRVYRIYGAALRVWEQV